MCAVDVVEMTEEDLGFIGEKKAKVGSIFSGAPDVPNNTS